ncbi:hypothetical protein KUCAC02_000520 [Chaenocephalus aceratus]|uniref:Uncharacterized protein n=1 Tax=Chaenocephalus aceratus TaxID=36190 RepID=A0ACB9W6I9_CHAAC|nr:hypothetical protein KUCAC02_000520 [Chaenocephalus aceratus]
MQPRGSEALLHVVRRWTKVAYLYLLKSTGSIGSHSSDKLAVDWLTLRCRGSLEMCTKVKINLLPRGEDSSDPCPGSRGGPHRAHAAALPSSLSGQGQGQEDNRGVSGEQYDPIFDVTSSLLSCL